MADVIRAAGRSPGHRERLMLARQQLGLSHAEMAARLLTPRQTYAQWEAGSRRTPGTAVVAAELLMQQRPDGWHLGIDWVASLKVAQERGENLSEMARRLGCSPESARVAAQKHDMHFSAPTRPRGIDWDAEFLVAINRDETASECARRLGVSVTSVRPAARRRNVRLVDGRTRGGVTRRRVQKLG